MNAQTVIQSRQFPAINGDMQIAADRVAAIIKRLVGLDYSFCSPTKKISKEGEFSLHSLSFERGKSGFELKVFPFPLHENSSLLD